MSIVAISETAGSSAIEIGRTLAATLGYAFADRDNFYLDAEDAALLTDLERYIRARLGPALEGG
jgi:hypothetical protein